MSVEGVTARHVGEDGPVTDAAPDPKAEWWTTTEVAAYLGVGVPTVSAYRSRRQMPLPDQTIGRTHMWRPERIIKWRHPDPEELEQGDFSLDAAAPDEKSRWVVHGKRSIYESEWVRLGLTDVELPDGERFEHHVVWMPSAAMTALLDDEGAHVLLMWRHRFVPDVWNWEMPGGIVEEGEDPAVTAAREIEEETGYKPRRLEHLVTFEPMIGMLQSPHHVFLGHGAQKVGEPSEKTEMQRMEWVPLSRVPSLINGGKVLNSGTLVALLHVLAISGPGANRGEGV